MFLKENNLIYKESNTYFLKSYVVPGMVRLPKSSFHLSQWVLRHSSLEGSDKLVAATIATYAGTKIGQYAHPSIAQIAATSGRSSMTVNRAIEKMKLSGEWLIFSGRRKDFGKGGAIANSYIPLAPKFDDLSARIKHHPNMHQWETSWFKDLIISRIPVGLQEDEQTLFPERYLEEYKKFVLSLDKSQYGIDD